MKFIHQQGQVSEVELVRLAEDFRATLVEMGIEIE